MAITEQDYRELVRQAAYEQAKLSSSFFFDNSDDQLRLTTFGSVASVTLTIEGRHMNLDGNVEVLYETHTPNSDRTIATSFYHIGTGFLLNVHVRASAGSPRIGQVYAILEVVRTINTTVRPIALLYQGYVTDTMRFGWPNSPTRPSADGPGVVRSVTGTDPAAGAEFTETVPTNARWSLYSLAVVFVTSSAAAGREPRIVCDDGTTTFFQSDPPASQAASETWTWVASVGVPRTSRVSTSQVWGFPSQMILMGASRVRSSTTAIQTGDNWAAPQMLLEEWIED